MPPVYLRLAIPSPLRRLFDYLPPNDITLSRLADLKPGLRCLVSFGKQKAVVGFLIEVVNHTEVPLEKLKPVDAILDEEPFLTAANLELAHWVANYYQHPLGEVLWGALPGVLRKGGPLPRARAWRHLPEGKGLGPQALKRNKSQQAVHQYLLREQLLTQEQCRAQGFKTSAVKQLMEKGLVEETWVQQAFKPPTDILREPHQQATDEQKAALSAVHLGQFQAVLLDGTTGSGKTEVYLQLIGRALEQGKQALVLVPEIGLAPQTLARFRQRFCVPLVELHSNLSEGERVKHWWAAAQGEARIVIGTRLALFTPMADLGVIIVDEEHDASFKQNEGLRYSARDLSLVRGQLEQVPVVLGSATPSLETLNNAQAGRYLHLRLTQRAGPAQAPSISLVDMRLEKQQAGLSMTSLDALDACVGRGEQALVFINRRGYSPSLLCQDCGWSAQCARCDAPMTLHLSPYHLHCHHCDAQQQPPNRCPNCHSERLMPLGQGTEKAEEFLITQFADVQVSRVDQDSMGRKHAMQELLNRVHSGIPCILVGTQMLAKGHHFPNLTLVVIVDADQGLLSGDFRATERLGQLITQVSGRAGRAALPGQVLLQTFKPDHPLMQCLLEQNYSAYAQMILAERRQINLPPFGGLALIRVEDKDAQKAQEFLTKIRTLAEQIHAPSPHYQYLGPIPALLEKRNHFYRYQLHLRTGSKSNLQQLLKPLMAALQDWPQATRLRWSLDVDPQDLT
jgi:primosomal protein N' (replication factor Y) (superfamily II helicase)